jgi:integrase
MGLGPVEHLSLAEARLEAERWRKLARSGVDPIKERARVKAAAAADRPTLSMVTEQAFEARKAELKNDGKAGRWDSPLRVHVLPKLGKTPIDEIDQNDIRRILAPIWHDKPEAAKKAIDRLRIILRYGAAMGVDVDLQAADKAKALMGAQRRERKNIPAMPWREVPAFYQSLTDGSPAQLALRLLILTACRSAEVRLLHLDEIDGDLWRIPAHRTKTQWKTGQAHVVPLSDEAAAVIAAAEPLARGGCLFPGRGDGVISDMTMSAILKRRGLEARPHGFRSSFRTWAAEATDTPREVAEACLSHVTAGKVEAAYARTTYLDRRRILMQRWAGSLRRPRGESARLVLAVGLHYADHTRCPARMSGVDDAVNCVVIAKETVCLVD